MAVRRHRLNPFKLLCLVLYGDYDFVSWAAEGQVELRNGPMARLMRVPNSRLKEYLEWLSHWNYIESLETDEYGVSRFQVNVPARWSDKLNASSFLLPEEMGEL